MICGKQLNVPLFEGGVTRYEHRATVTHVGPNSADGHYITYRRTEKEQFFKINDAKVEQIQSDEMFDSIALIGGGPEDETPYILIYDQISSL